MLPAASDPVNDIFGTVSPPPGFLTFDNPQAGISQLLGKGLALFITAASLILLIFLLWGAMDWILSGGEKEKIQKAQSKLTNAVLGFIMIFVLLGVFGVITGDILGIMKKGTDGSWIFTLPTLGNTSPSGGSGCTSPDYCASTTRCLNDGGSPGAGICTAGSCCHIP